MPAWRQERAHAGRPKLHDRSTWKVLETVLPPPPAVKKGEEKSSGMGRRVGAVRKLFKSQLTCWSLCLSPFEEVPRGTQQACQGPSLKHKQVRDPQSSTEQPCADLSLSLCTCISLSLKGWGGWEAASLSSSNPLPLSLYCSTPLLRGTVFELHQARLGAWLAETLKWG